MTDSSTSRPKLTRELPSAEFASWYWLKQELVEFCRRERLPASGPKLVLAERIQAHLDGRTPSVTKSPRRRSGPMPSSFTRETVIGQGWRCTQDLRVFFTEECGPGFRFNGPLRDFIRNRAGATLAEAIDCYLESLNEKREIPPQLEYNRHMREFFEKNPGATAAEAREAWWRKRGRPTD